MNGQKVCFNDHASSNPEQDFAANMDTSSVQDHLLETH